MRVGMKVMSGGVLRIDTQAEDSTTNGRENAFPGMPDLEFNVWFPGFILRAVIHDASLDNLLEKVWDGGRIDEAEAFRHGDFLVGILNRVNASGV